MKHKEDDTVTKEVLDIPDWSQAPRARANEGWIKMIEQKMCGDIEAVSQQGISLRELSTHHKLLPARSI